MLASSLKPDDDELLAFGDNWCGPDAYELHTETLVAKYECGDDDDGQTVEVYCTAMPARFYTMRALAAVSSVGDAIVPWEFGTGSSQAKLAADIAKAASEGMLSLHPQKNDARVVGGFFLGWDNSEPPQLWVWRGEPGDESSEPWLTLERFRRLAARDVE